MSSYIYGSSSSSSGYRAIVDASNGITTSNTTFSSGSGTPIFEVKYSDDDFINIEWIPKEDITTYELAKAIPYISSKQIIHSVTCEDYDSLEPEVKRHFKVSDNSSDIWSKYLKKKNINILQEKL